MRTVYKGLNGLLFRTERAMCDYYEIPYSFYLAKKDNGMDLKQIMDCYRGTMASKT